MLIRFDGRTAIAAGAARGIGQAIARWRVTALSVFACYLLVDEVVAIAGRLPHASAEGHRRCSDVAVALATSRGLPGRPSPSLPTRWSDAVVFRRNPNMRGRS